ncbi:MAG: TraB/GumN family protein [Chitinophagaceae bacterium]|nr:TraB/GumN family protein [Chitinophagaceae bacterium]
MKRPALIFTLIFCFCSTLIGQDSKPQYNSLLWKISGRDLKVPSYIYGTMHLMDKRLFNFPDSLYHFIETAEGYAAELDANEMSHEIVNEIKKRDDNDDLIINLLDVEELKPYKKQLESVFRKKMNAISVGDLRQQKSVAEGKLLRQGEMPTIMDVFLFNVARKQGKWVGGIEDFADQLKVEDEKAALISLIEGSIGDPKEYKKMIEWMIKTYIAQDLDAIDRGNEVWQGADLRSLNKRNLKMARRMDSIMTIRSCFFAVGAAHIPGDSGVVKLLREKGFTVEPVYSSKRIAAREYRYKSLEFAWEKVSVKDSWYEILMPGKADAMGETNTPGVEGHMHFDFLEFNFYYTNSTLMSRYVNADSLLSSMVTRNLKGKKVISEKPITINGVSGKEFVIHDQSGYIRLQGFPTNSVLVTNMIISQKKDSLYGVEANRFFNSFRVLKERPSSAIAGWTIHRLEDEGCSVLLPSNFTVSGRTFNPDSSMFMTTYKAVDEKRGCLLFLISMRIAPGYYSTWDTTYFKALKDEIAAKPNVKFIKSSYLAIQGYPALSYLLEASSDEGKVELVGTIINRGNRKYYLYAAYPDNDTSRLQMKEFIESIQFLPFPKDNWTMQKDLNDRFSLYAPELPRFDSASATTDSTQQIWQMYDSVTATSIFLNAIKLPRYSWWVSDSAFFRHQLQTFVHETDTVLNFNFSSVNSTHASMEIGLSDNHLVKKVGVYVQGDSLYRIWVFETPALLRETRFKKLFSDFNLKNQSAGKYYLENKTSLLFRDLNSSDSVIFEEASNYLSDAPFTKEDLPAIQTAALKTYRDSRKYYTVNDELMDRIAKIDKVQAIEFAKSNYHILPEQKANLRYSLLRMLAGIKTEESFILLKELAVAKAPTGDPESLRYALNDSAALTALLFPGILPLVADSNFVKVILQVLPRLLDSNLVTRETLMPFENLFYSEAKRQTLATDTLDYDVDALNLIEVLRYLKTTEGNVLIQQYLKASSAYLRLAAVGAALSNGLHVNASVLEKLAADKLSRASLYVTMKKLKRLNHFPPNWLTQKLIGESELFAYLSDEESPTSMEFLKIVTAVYLGKNQKFYLYKVRFDYEDKPEYRLAVIGPFPLTGTAILTDMPVLGTMYEEFDKGKIMEQLKAYLKEWEQAETVTPDLD